MVESIFNDLRKIIISIFPEEDREIDGFTKFVDIKGWDSLEHINLITSVMNHFNIKFSMDELDQMVNVESIVNLIECKMNVRHVR